MTVSVYSLRRQLLGWLLLATLIMGFLALIDTYRDAVRTADTVSDRVLAGSAMAIAERVIVSEDGQLQVDIPYVALEMLTSAAQDRVFYRVDGPPGQFITGYQNLPTFADLGGQAAFYTDAVFRGERIRIAVLQRSASTGINSVPFSVTVAETTIARRQLARSILLNSAARLALMIAGAAVIVWIAVTFSLRPLYRLSDAISERNPDDLHPIEQSVPSEVQGLVDTVNSFMTRLASALAALRNFTGNASHQLRTPLAIVRTQLELAQRATTLEEARAAAKEGDKAVVHAERVLAQLLLMAKIDSVEPEARQMPEPIDLVALAQQITADKVPSAAKASIDLGFEGEGQAWVAAEPLLIGELLGNLIGNAIAYAGRDAEVTVRVSQSGGSVRLEVEDNGPGILAARMESLKQRFVRGERGEGLGLGLAIVEEIARLFSGTFQLSPGGGGRGLLAAVTFPAAIGPAR
ncbi:sensor histidine kinase N-terminal domain-containing protein [Rhizobium cremeum]|uniref:sensor histidine kinase n=1 Tax=Rhizobium cremeum TaxID=2813827 RepID=UPI001FD16075|nr:sensor histidine kinase [Rhizobium cremeum]MCJ7993722.1 sensor histidine kinase N-terminal domain-containing protein [Rhizobium cremeum]MCJ7998779.1 sensor histidine kinase N-terminal domain-containing protein [Rhizobium cremeum]